MIIKSIIDGNILDVDPILSKHVVSEAIRKLHDSASSFRGEKKFLGHPVWSMKALIILSEHEEIISRCESKLSHEHIVPINIIVKKLFGCPKGTPLETYRSIILTYAAVAIITREENKLFDKHKLGRSMPKCWDNKDVFARYKYVGLYEQLKSSKKFTQKNK
jgi:hypothetical protein